MNAYARIPIRITLRNLKSAVRAAIVNDNIIPVLIALSKNALDAIGQEFLAIINGRNDADERLFGGIQRLVIEIGDVVLRHRFKKGYSVRYRSVRAAFHFSCSASACPLT